LDRLGSFLIFSALDIDQAKEKTATVQNPEVVLRRSSNTPLPCISSQNQLRLLELAALHGLSERNIATRLNDWARFAASTSNRFRGQHRNANVQQLLVAYIGVIGSESVNPRWTIGAEICVLEQYAQLIAAVEDLLSLLPAAHSCQIY
jgi:hypothetical protein